VRTTKRAFNNFYSNHIKLKSTEVQSGKSYDEKNFFQPYLMSPREYLFAALWTFLIGAVFIGLALLFILVIEIEALSLGGILIYFLLIAGGIAVMVVPILLIVALISYLFGY
jgi:hypothetical protein